MTLDFDEVDSWAPELDALLGTLLPNDFASTLRRARVRYLEEALDHVLGHVDRQGFIETAVAWMRRGTIFGYHGTRLTDDELLSVRSRGLLPLEVRTRRARITRALSKHPRWLQVADALDAALEACGPGEAAGRRQGQVHLTLSRAGLVNSFNHYLTHGSEVDQHIAHRLLGKEGFELLASDGVPLVLKVEVPGSEALEAANPFFTVEERVAMAEVPNLLGHFLMAWSFRFVEPNFRPKELCADCGMIFSTPLPPNWLTQVETLSAEELSAY